MKTENWNNIKDVLLEALNLDVSARNIFLSGANISPEVRAEVESLLAFEEESEDLMRLSAVEFSKDFFDEDGANGLIGQNLGVYKIVGELGQGGMGAVYLAERSDGKFKQKVALKLLKREMNTSALRRRFQQEREILASLEHPNIARLLDAGTTSDKVPFLAMEYVEGLPIDEYCTVKKLDLNQRLDLFRQVCSTVNFAHRNLIVHRDLKPSNILVNDEGIPKLLDFGISKILSAEFEQINSATVTRLGAMTPQYASPEQMQNKSVTTATDIYSLGVILYELLSGHRPFESKEADIKEIYRAVLETEPTPPSVVVIQNSGFRIQDSESETVLIPNRTNRQTRQTNPESRTLNPKSLSGDLDNIVLKALRKEPERRYSSAENFAEDLHRHQRGLPVTARPNTFSYRAEKFFRRNQFSVIAGILVLLAIIGGIAATLWQAKVAQAERSIAQIERAKAERRFGDVRKLANSYLFEVFPEIQDLEGSLKAREKIVSTALEYLDSLSKEAAGDTDLQLELAMAYEKIGDVQGALSIANLGDIKAGLESGDKARQMREAVLANNPADLKNKDLLARNYQTAAQTLVWNIDTAQAAEYYEKAIKLRRELVAEKPESPDYQNRLAVALTFYAVIPIVNVENEKAAKLLEESAVIIKETLKVSPDHLNTRKAYPRILRAYSQLYSNTGDYDAAIKALDESVALTADLIKQKPDDYALQRTAFLNDFGYCEVYAAQGDGRKIVESCLKTVDFNVKALAKEPDESFALYDLGITYYNLARGYRLLNDPQRASEYAEKARVPLSKLAALSPGINDYERGIAVVETELAAAFLMRNNPEEALRHLSNGQTKLEKSIESDPTVKTYQLELAKIYRTTAAAHHKKSDQAKAAEFIEKAISIVRRLKENNNLRDRTKICRPNSKPNAPVTAFEPPASLHDRRFRRT